MLSHPLFVFRTSALCLLSAFLVATLPVHAGTIDQLVVFGDSLSDNGNAAIALGGTLAGDDYAANAFTDGPATTPATTGPFGLWTDQLAAKLGVPDPLPFLAGGTDFAVASALTGHNTAFSVPPFPPTAVPYTSDQVALYLALGNIPSSSTLYTFWAGANDIDSGDNPITAADNIESNIQTLAALGATNFLWLNLPPLGDTPDGLASGVVDSTLLNLASGAFDTEWLKDVTALQAEGIGVDGVNTALLFNQITGDPPAFGFTNVTNPAWCEPGGLCASNPNQFLYWDGEHPTTAADAQVASLAFADITATPEPSGFSLSFLGLCAIFIVSVMQRRKSMCSSGGTVSPALR